VNSTAKARPVSKRFAETPGFPAASTIRHSKRQNATPNERQRPLARKPWWRSGASNGLCGHLGLRTAEGAVRPTALGPTASPTAPRVELVWRAPATCVSGCVRPYSNLARYADPLPRATRRCARSADGSRRAWIRRELDRHRPKRFKHLLEAIVAGRRLRTQVAANTVAAPQVPVALQGLRQAACL